MAEKPIIEVQGLTKRFKGLTAVHDVSFSVEKGSITGMIGPNGAGKSTTFNMICGYYPPTEGKIFYNGEDITNKKAYEYTNMKIARTFQIMKPLKNLSVLDNVTAAAYFGHAGAKSEKEAKERAMEVLHFTGLYEKRHVISKDMGTPDQKRLEMARALATKPEVLFLDENMAGLNPAETEEAIQLIRKINESGVTILLIEHIMKAVVSLCEKIIVLHHGEKIAEGTPEQVMNDPYVMEVYLGTKRRAQVLKVEGLNAGYGSVNILWDIGFEVKDGEIVAILGSNGAGKTTMVRTITGMVKASSGKVEFNGEDLSGKSSRVILDSGIVQVPEGRQLFTEMTVLENLELGAFNKETKAHFAENLEKCYNWFPKLRERAKQAAGTLSGGEQQMVAVARALIGMPKLLILDEPSLGLAPNIVDDILEVAKTMVKNDGISVLLVEQDITKALAAADRGYVIENGRVALEGTAAELSANEHVKKAYLGI